jgi:hypothetical protein
MRNTHEITGPIRPSLDEYINEDLDLMEIFEEMKKDIQYKMSFLLTRAFVLQNEITNLRKQSKDFTNDPKNKKQSRAVNRRIDEFDERIVKLLNSRMETLSELVELALENGYLDKEGRLDMSFDVTSTTIDDDLQEDYQLSLIIEEKVTKEKIEANNELENITFYEIALRETFEIETKELIIKLEDLILRNLFNEARTLIPEAELDEYKKMLNNFESAEPGIKDDKTREELVKYLKKVYPQYEEVMLEKQLELKKKLLLARLKKVTESRWSNRDIRKKLDEIKELMDGGEWIKALDLLNKLPPSK